MPNKICQTVALLAPLALLGAAHAQSSVDLARYFGFDEARTIVIDDGCGPAIVADFDGDGRQDFAIVNNRKSRIEIHTQRSRPRTDAEIERDFKVNDLKPSEWYDRTEVSVAHRVSALRAHDIDNDGMLDIIYAGQPSTIVVLRQVSPMSFDQDAKRRINGITAGQDGFAIANVTGDSAQDLLVLVEGKINVYSLGSAGAIGEPTTLGTSGQIVAFFIEDYNGDGKQDILAAIPDDSSPVRLWLQQPDRGARTTSLGAEIRFEMPAIREVEPVRIPGQAAASIGIIERASRRIVLYDLTTSHIDLNLDADEMIETDAIAEVYSFKGGNDKDRSVVLADVNADGLTDILATDKDGNAIALHTQTLGSGIGPGKVFSAFKEPKTIDVGQWDDDPELEIFLLSEEEKVVGVSNLNTKNDRISFPQPLQIATAGATPVAMGYIGSDSGPAVGVVVREKRNHWLEIHRPGTSDVRVIELTDVNRPPQSMIAGDYDHDGELDVILFTPNEPMVMVRSIEGEAQVLTDESMPQFGLVQAAGPDNTTMLDVDGDGHDELLIADENFVRACTFNAETGWRVVDQVTTPDASASLRGLAVLELNGKKTIVASDETNNRLVLMASDADGAWGVIGSLLMTGFDVGSIRAGSLLGNGEPNVLCLSDSSFATVRLSGERVSLDEFAAYRSDDDDRLEHEMEVADLNGDGYVDIVVLDAREQMCQIFTLSAARKLLLATEFKVFESRLFSRGESREFEPSAALLQDVTGDGRTDLVLEVHDRYIVYPQAGK